MFSQPLLKLSDTIVLSRIEPVQPISIPTPPNKRRDWTPDFVKSCAHQGLIETYPERPDAGPRALGFGIFFGGIIWAAIALVWWLV